MDKCSSDYRTDVQPKCENWPWFCITLCHIRNNADGEAVKRSRMFIANDEALQVSHALGGGTQLQLQVGDSDNLESFKMKVQWLESILSEYKVSWYLLK